MDPRYAGVVATVSMCFDGLYHSEAARLANVLHAQAHYVCATENPHLYMRMDECFRALDQRPSPASRGEARRDEIESVECAGPVTALARVTCAIGPKHFIELLTLIFIDGKSQTISKMFHFDVL
ncbi:MAG: nuclear transport factor 2 family protein, partial [Gammaproteobacteria bacterium]